MASCHGRIKFPRTGFFWCVLKSGHPGEHLARGIVTTSRPHRAFSLRWENVYQPDSQGPERRNP